MRRIPIAQPPSAFPEVYRPLLTPGSLYDSSCSPEARVWYLDTRGGLFLKRGTAGSLETEAAMTAWFHSRGLSARVLDYRREDGCDWLLTARLPGEDCTHPDCLSQPERLCDTLAALLRQLHELDTRDCPVPDRNAAWLRNAREGRSRGRFDPDLFSGIWDFACAEEAWHCLETGSAFLRCDTLLHGDYCLPNILLDRWQFSGFIDLGCSGVGDRHIDLLWGLWTLNFNLHTNAFFDRFLDAYGREAVEPELLRCVAAAETFG